MIHLLLTEVFPPRTGGSGRWLWEIYRRFPRESIRVVTSEHTGYKIFDRTHDLNLYRTSLTFASWGLLGRNGISQYGRTLRTLRTLVSSTGIGLVHCGKCLPEGLLAWLLKRISGVPYVCYVHGEELSIAAGSRELRFLAQRVLRGANYVIANSHNTANLLKLDWKLPAERLRVLHPGMDAQWFVPAPHSPSIRAGLGWHDRPVVLTVGRLQKRKGHDMLIRALPAICREVPDVLYAIIGEGEEREQLEALVHELQLENSVKFHGELNETALRNCYQQCDLFVLPNRRVGDDFEGFGMVLLEAQSCGKPVVAGASGGTIETMLPHETGEVIPCETPEPLAQVVTALLRDKDRRQRMGLAAREWVAGHFDWTSLSRQAHDLFEIRSSLAPVDHAVEPVLS